MPAEHCAKFAATLVNLAHRLDPCKYIKHKRGPKTKQPEGWMRETRHNPQWMAVSRHHSHFEHFAGDADDELLEDA